MESKPPQLTLSKRVGKRKPKHYVQAVHTTCPELWHVCFSMFLKWFPQNGKIQQIQVDQSGWKNAFKATIDLKAHWHTVDSSEIPNNHLRCIKNPGKSWDKVINYQPQLIFSPDFFQPSTVSHRVPRKKMQHKTGTMAAKASRLQKQNQRISGSMAELVGKYPP